jgi:hypothetical protein
MTSLISVLVCSYFLFLFPFVLPFLSFSYFFFFRIPFWTFLGYHNSLTTYEMTLHVNEITLICCHTFRDQNSDFVLAFLAFFFHLFIDWIFLPYRSIILFPYRIIFLGFDV